MQWMVETKKNCGADITESESNPKFNIKSIFLFNINFKNLS